MLGVGWERSRHHSSHGSARDQPGPENERGQDEYSLHTFNNMVFSM